jgi:hypothetical protein
MKREENPVTRLKSFRTQGMTQISGYFHAYGSKKPEFYPECVVFIPSEQPIEANGAK